MKQRLILSLVCSFFWIAPASAAEPAPLPPASEPKAQVLEVPATMAPHHAVYEISLQRAKIGSPVSQVAGTMVFDLSDACDGWSVQQQMKMRFDLAEGGSSQVVSSVATWEAKDGSSFHFTVKRVTDGKEDSNYKGVVTTENGERIARYTSPEGKEALKLAAQDLFPTAHTVMIIKEALAQEKMFTRRIFDGSEDEGAADASAFIGAMTAVDPKAVWGEGIKEKTLLDKPSWPVRLAYYKPDDQASQPDYEMELVLQQNGIARSMMIDYGDFSIQGKLVGLEKTEGGAGCAAKK